MRRSVRRCAIALSVAVVLAATSAPEALAQKSAAENLYEEAWTAMDKGDYDTACQKFEASYNVSRATGPLQGMARCEEGRKRLARALEHWRELERRLPETSGTKTEAKTNIQRLEGLLARLVLRLAPGAPPDTRVELDGAPVPADGKERPVDPDVPHKVRTSAAGHGDRNDEVTLPRGGSKTLTLAPLSSTAGSAGVGPDAPEDDRSGLRIAGFVAGGIGLASAVVAGITGGMMLAADSDIDDACGDRDSCQDDQAANDARQRGEDLVVPNAIAFVGAIAGIGAGVTLLVIASGGGDRSPPAVEMRASILPGGLSLRGRF